MQINMQTDVVARTLGNDSNPVLPVTLATAKQFCGIDYSDDDALVSTFVAAATSYVESHLSRCLITTTFDTYFDAFPSGGGYLNRAVRHGYPNPLNWLPTSIGEFKLPRPPLQSITWVKYVDQSNTLVTLDDSVYSMRNPSEGQGLIYSNPGKSFPVTAVVPGAIQIRYVAGYGDDATAVPDGIKNTILMIVRHLNDHRYAATDVAIKQMDFGVDALLAPFQWGNYA